MSAPLYYRADIRQLPQLRTIKMYRVQDFAYLFPGVSSRYCEFAFIQEGRLLEQTPEGTEILEAGTVLATVLGRPVSHRSDSPSFQSFEACVIFHTPLQPMTEDEVRRWVPTVGEAIIVTRVADAKVTAELEKHIKVVVQLYRSGRRNRFLAVYSELLRILQIMTDYAVVRAHEENSTRSRPNEYCRLACDYVAEHLDRPIREEELARALGISTAYLSRQFSRFMGMTLTEYIHRTKLQQVVHLILDVGVTLQQAADAVGISSTKYLSRLFRQYMGMSVTQYKKVHAQGLGVVHEKAES